MKKKLLSVLLASAMVATMLTGCGGTTDPATSAKEETKQEESKKEEKKEESKEESQADGSALEYSGTLELMHFSTSEESEGNGGSDGFRTVLAQWKEANPNIALEENVLANADYKTQIATLAAADDLPDVFLLQGMNTVAWADQGIIYDMTDTIKASPYYDKYIQNLFTPFNYDGKTYALPALTGGTCTVVVYDKAVWGDTFPATWDEVEAKAAEIEATPIAFGNSGKWNANSCFLSALGDRYTGPDWFQSLVVKDGAAFDEPEFVAALAETQRLFTETSLFNKDFNAITNEDAREYYVSGEAAAFIGGNWDVSYLQATLKESNQELYENTGFAVIPQSSDATNQRTSQNNGLGYGLAINTKVADDPAKLAAAIDLIYTLTGPDFANYVVENYALGALTDVGEVDFSGQDKWVEDFYNYSFVDHDKCEIYDSYLSSAVWDVLNTGLQELMNGKGTPENLAKLTQDAYLDNY